MVGERLGLSPADEQSLLPLVRKSTLLDIKRGKVVAKDKIDIPTDEFGLPLREKFIRDVLGTITEAHTWTGDYDLHHLAWHGQKFRDVQSNLHPFVGSQFRGAPQNKVILRRQCHNYIHTVSNELPIPDFGVMVQAGVETGQVVRLADTVSFKNYADTDLTEDEKEAKRHENYLAKLENMQQGYLGIMPDIEALYVMDLPSARQSLRAIARVRGLSNAKKSRRSFFSLAA